MGKKARSTKAPVNQPPKKEGFKQKLQRLVAIRSKKKSIKK